MTAPGATITLLLGVLCAALPARADMGPCRLDANEELTCGIGAGAARIIDDTQSPNKKLAFAWSLPNADPDALPDEDDKIDLLLVRLADGVILGKSYTGFWANGHGRNEHKREEITWSRNGRLTARVYQTQFETDTFELYALDAKGELAGKLDLYKIVEPAVRAQMKGYVPPADGYSFSVQAGKRLKLGNDGAMRLTVMMWEPKDGPEKYFDVTLRVASGKDGLSATIASIKPGRVPK
jgi:hypothetical protein